MAARIGLKALLQSPKAPSHSPLSSLFTPLPGPTQPVSKPETSMLGPSQPAPNSTIKFLCSYGGKILPRYPDGKLRYLGGHTRVLAVDRSVPLSELLSKLEEMCGSFVRQLRCQLPAEDLDALVSITSDEDLANLIEEYDRVSPPPPSLKIRAFLSPPRSLNKVSTPPSSFLSKSASSSSSSASSSSSSSSYCSLPGGNCGRRCVAAPIVNRCVHQMAPPTAYPVGVEKSSRRNIPLPRYGYHAQGNTGHVYLIHNGNHWQ